MGNISSGEDHLGIGRKRWKLKSSYKAGTPLASEELKDLEREFELEEQEKKRRLRQETLRRASPDSPFTTILPTSHGTDVEGMTLLYLSPLEIMNYCNSSKLIQKKCSKTRFWENYGRMYLSSMRERGAEQKGIEMLNLLVANNIEYPDKYSLKRIKGLILGGADFRHYCPQSPQNAIRALALTLKCGKWRGEDFLVKYAAFHGRDQILDLFFKLGAKLSPALLTAAAEGGHRETVDYLVEKYYQKGLEMYKRRAGTTRLSDDTKAGVFKIIVKTYIVKSGALTAAARTGRLDVVRDLLALGAGDQPAQRDAAIRAARRRGHNHVVRLLESGGVEGWTDRFRNWWEGYGF